MAYQIQDLDPVKELSPTRKGIEFGVVFVIVFSPPALADGTMTWIRSTIPCIRPPGSPC
jgi:hypothetical protein